MVDGVDCRMGGSHCCQVPHYGTSHGAIALVSPLQCGAVMFKSCRSGGQAPGHVQAQLEDHVHVSLLVVQLQWLLVKVIAWGEVSKTFVREYHVVCLTSTGSSADSLSLCKPCCKCKLCCHAVVHRPAAVASTITRLSQRMHTMWQ